MKSAALVVVVSAAACFVACRSPSAAKPIEAPLEIAPLDAGAPPKATLPNPAEAELDLAEFVASERVQGLTSAYGGAFLNVAAIRALPVATRIREIVENATKGMRIFDDVEWVLWVGPHIQRADDGLLLIGVRPGADVKWSVERLVRGSSSSPSRGLDEVEMEGVRGWRLPGGKVVLRLRDDLVAVVYPFQQRVTIANFRAASIGKPPSRELASMYATGIGARLTGLSTYPGHASFEEIRLAIETRPAGAEVRAVGRCADAATATTYAQQITDTVHQMNSGTVRIMTRGILNDVKATVQGESVVMRIPVSERQLELLVQALVSIP